MLKKRSASQNSRKKSFKKKPNTPKKSLCLVCEPKCGMVILTQKSLYKKYSYHHLSEPAMIDKYIAEKPREVETGKEYLEKYYKNMQRKHELPRIKEVYKHHQESPRLFMDGIRQIIAKCYHRKRLLEYFKIAKILGIRVDTVKFSTFVLSLTRTFQEKERRKKMYHPIIGKISGYEFSEEIEKQLIDILSKEDRQNPEADWDGQAGQIEV